MKKINELKESKIYQTQSIGLFNSSKEINDGNILAFIGDKKDDFIYLF